MAPTDRSVAPGATAPLTGCRQIKQLKSYKTRFYLTKERERTSTGTTETSQNYNLTSNWRNLEQPTQTRSQCLQATTSAKPGAPLSKHWLRDQKVNKLQPQL